MSETVDTLVETPSDAPQQEAESVAADNNAETETPAEVPEEPKESEEDRVKKLSKALERDKRKIGKLHAISAQERERADRLEQALAEFSKRFPAEQQTLDENQFDNYGEFIKADTKQTVEKTVDEKIQAFVKQQQEQQNQQAWVNSNIQLRNQEEVKIKADIPDYDAVVSPHFETIQAMPAHVKMAGLTVPNASIGVYQLVAEDALDDLFYMDFETAKKTVADAVQRGEAALKAKRTTKAPTPIEKSRSAGTATKSLDRMSAQELMAWARSGRG